MSTAPHRFRLPLGVALQSYWPWLLPLVATAALLFFFTKLRGSFSNHRGAVLYQRLFRDGAMVVF